MVCGQCFDAYVIQVQSINQSMGFVKRLLQNWTAALDRSTVIKYDKIKCNKMQWTTISSSCRQIWVENAVNIVYYRTQLCGRPPQYAPAPASWPLTFWPWKWCLSQVWSAWATSVPILVFLALSVLDWGLCPMYATDRETSDRRQMRIIT